MRLTRPNRIDISRLPKQLWDGLVVMFRHKATRRLSRWAPYFVFLYAFPAMLGYLYSEESQIPQLRTHSVSTVSLDETQERISQYDEIIHRHAYEQGLDWRLIASIIFAESSFRERVVSPAGAVGLMQIMPVVARENGLRRKAIYHPEDNIRTGVRHFRKKISVIEGATDEDSLKLSLAAYNAGLGHLRDAQRLTKKLRRNPKKWNDVARALLLLEQPEFFSKAYYGYCRGSETVEYVKRVTSVYEFYRESYPARPSFVLRTQQNDRVRAAMDS